MRALFINENIGGHATVHHHLQRAFEGRRDITTRWLSVPPPNLPRRIWGAALPGLGRFDLDLQPLRGQLGVSAWVARHLDPALEWADVVHLYTQNAGLLSTRRLRGVPTVVTSDSTNALNAFRLPYRSPTRWTPRVLRLTQWFERRVYDSATLVVANSEWVARSLRDDYHLAGDRVRVLPFGIVPPAVDPPAAPGTGADRPTIAFVGTSLERKGGRLLLRLHQDHLRDRADLRLVTHDLVPPTPAVEVVNDLHPGDDRLWALLRSSAVFAFPSGIDQAPNAVLEAMAAGLPVVALDTGAVPEMVGHGETGFVLPVGDDAALLDALTRLIDDPALRTTMGAAGRARLLERYDATRAADALVAILAEAIADGPGPTRSRSGGYA